MEILGSNPPVHAVVAVRTCISLRPLQPAYGNMEKFEQLSELLQYFGIVMETYQLANFLGF